MKCKKRGTGSVEDKIILQIQFCLYFSILILRVFITSILNQTKHKQSNIDNNIKKEQAKHSFILSTMQGSEP